MITCVVEYVIDPAKIDAFETFARRWLELVDARGIPSEQYAPHFALVRQITADADHIPRHALQAW